MLSWEHWGCPVPALVGDVGTWLSCVLLCSPLYRSNVPGKQPGFSRNSPSQAAGPCKTPSLRKWGQRWAFLGPDPMDSAAEQLHVGVCRAAVTHCHFLFLPRTWKSPDFPWGEGCGAMLPAGPVPPELWEEAGRGQTLPCAGSWQCRAGAVQGAWMGPGRNRAGVPGSHKTIPCFNKPFCAPLASLWGCGG